MYNPIKKRLLIIGCVLVVIPGWVLISYNIPDFLHPLETAPRHQDMNDPAFRHDMERMMGIVFPPVTKWSGCHLTCWQDAQFYCRCEMPKQDIGKLLPGKSLSWSSSGSKISADSIKEKWFKPGGIKQYRYAELEHPRPNSFLRILYDDSVSTESLTSVYIEWFDM